MSKVRMLGKIILSKVFYKMNIENFKLVPFFPVFWSQWTHATQSESKSRVFVQSHTSLNTCCCLMLWYIFAAKMAHIFFCRCQFHFVPPLLHSEREKWVVGTRYYYSGFSKVKHAQKSNKTTIKIKEGVAIQAWKTMDWLWQVFWGLCDSNRSLIMSSFMYIIINIQDVFSWLSWQCCWSTGQYWWQKSYVLFNQNGIWAEDLGD